MTGDDERNRGGPGGLEEGTRLAGGARTLAKKEGRIRPSIRYRPLLDQKGKEQKLIWRSGIDPHFETSGRDTRIMDGLRLN